MGNGVMMVVMRSWSIPRVYRHNIVLACNDRTDLKYHS